MALVNGFMRRIVQTLMVAILAMMMGATLAAGTSSADSNWSTLPLAKNSVVFTVGSPNVVIDGQGYLVDTSPYIDQNGRMMLPVRYVANVLGAYNIVWDPTSQDLQLQFDHNFQSTGGADYETTLEFQIGRLAYRVYGVWRKNGQMGQTGSQSWTPMDTAPQIVYPGRTMLPVRVIAEALGDKVSYDSFNKTVTITVESFTPPTT